MIPVALADEPPDFDQAVRIPGNAFLASLPPRSKVDFTNREYWRKAIPDLSAAYKRICAYTCHWISLDTGGNSADHFVSRNVNPSLAYEWDNLRFACSRLNARKGTKAVIDPFAVNLGMFRIDFSSLFVFVSEQFADNKLLFDTIDILKLNDDVVVDSREEYVTLYADGIVNLEYLSLRAPFIHLELVRQGISNEDLVAMGY